MGAAPQLQGMSGVRADTTVHGEANGTVASRLVAGRQAVGRTAAVRRRLVTESMRRQRRSAKLLLPPEHLARVDPSSARHLGSNRARLHRRRNNVHGISVSGAGLPWPDLHNTFKDAAIPTAHTPDF